MNGRLTTANFKLEPRSVYCRAHIPGKSFFSNMRAVRMCVFEHVLVITDGLQALPFPLCVHLAIAVAGSFGSYQCSYRGVVQQLYKAPTKHLEDLPSQSMLKHSKNIVASSDCRRALLPISPWLSTWKIYPRNQR